MAKIEKFNSDLMVSCSVVDPQTGRRYMMADDNRYQIMLQREKDLFFLNEGFKVEEVSRYVRMHPVEMGAMTPQQLQELKAKFDQDVKQAEAEMAKATKRP